MKPHSTDVATESIVLRTREGTPQPTFRLVVTAGPDQTKAFVIDGESPSRVLVGTGATCHWQLTDPGISRRHLALALRDGALALEDAGSTNGTFIGTLRVKDVALSGGEEIALGGTRLQVERLAAGAVVALPREASFGRVVGASFAMRRLHPTLQRLAQATGPVLIEGEPGTGKELLAEVLHEEGPRSQGPFAVFDSTRSDAARLDALLFGTREAPGALEQARGGTLVVDEPSELPPRLQASLARFLEGRTVPREDGTELAPLDVRVIAISRSDLEREVQAGRLREDLALVLGGARVELPPLREREGDVALLASTFFREQRLEDRVLPPLTVRRFEAHSWPGNVRELQRAIVRFAMTGDDATAPLAAFRAEERATAPTELYERVLAADLPIGQAREIVLEDFERRFVRVVLEKNKGNVTRAAAASGVARRYFQLLRLKRGV